MARKKHQTYEGLGKKNRDKVPVKKGLTKKKKEQKDFQKVKLKAGKLRPKGLNETKLEFKSKSILIREQLRPDLGPEKIQVNRLETFSSFRPIRRFRIFCFDYAKAHPHRNWPCSTR